MFKIREFSRFTRVSVKMLRHYDEIGLFCPAYTEPSNNYRYYNANQLPRLNRIIALKELGFSLNDIARLLDSNLPDQEIIGMFRLRKAEITQKINSEQKRLRELESRLRLMETSEDKLGRDIIVRPVAAQWIASIRIKIPTSTNIAPIFEEVETFVASQNARAERSPLAIYHDEEYEQEEMDIELAAPVVKPTLQTNGRIIVRELSAEDAMACLTFNGSYDQTAGLLNTMLYWMENHHYQICGPLRELYHRFNAVELGHLSLPESFLTAREAELVTELQIPVKSNTGKRIVYAEEGR